MGDWNVQSVLHCLLDFSVATFHILALNMLKLDVCSHHKLWISWNSALGKIPKGGATVWCDSRGQQSALLLLCTGFMRKDKVCCGISTWFICSLSTIQRRVENKQWLKQFWKGSRSSRSAVNQSPSWWPNGPNQIKYKSKQLWHTNLLYRLANFYPVPQTDTTAGIFDQDNQTFTFPSLITKRLIVYIFLRKQAPSTTFVIYIVHENWHGDWGKKMRILS